MNDSSIREICILCMLSGLEMSEEHVFPEALGGKIKESILCRICNSKLGEHVDAPYLAQKHIQLARAMYRIPGKTGRIPRSFSDEYQIETLGGLARLCVDEDFKPYFIPDAPIVYATADNSVHFSFSRDVRYRAQIPELINKTLTRFFEREEGKRLGWTEEQKQIAIQSCIDNAVKLEPVEEKIQTTLHGRMEISLTVLFMECVKVIYELACIEFGFDFLHTNDANGMRELLNKAIASDDRV